VGWKIDAGGIAGICQWDRREMPVGWKEDARERSSERDNAREKKKNITRK